MQGAGAMHPAKFSNPFGQDKSIILFECLKTLERVTFSSGFPLCSLFSPVKRTGKNDKESNFPLLVAEKGLNVVRMV